MTYTPYHNPWEDYPGVSTPITAAALDYIEAGIVAASQVAASSGNPYWALASNVSAAATTITIATVPPSGIASRASVIAIDPGTLQCEIRRIASITGSTMTLNSALAFDHLAGAPVVWMQTQDIPASYFTVKSNNTTDDTIAMQRATDEVSAQGLWLCGFNSPQFMQMSAPLFTRSGTRLRSCNMRCTNTYGPIDTTNALLQSSQGNILPFTASAATNEFTTTGTHGIPGDGILVAFKGTSLPGGITGGRIYYAMERGVTTFKVSEDATNLSAAALAGAATVSVFSTTGFPASGTLTTATGATFTYTGVTGTSFTGCAGTPALGDGAKVIGEAVDLSSDGSGTVYCEINSLERLVLDDVYLSLFSAPGNANGIFTYLQQPNYWNKVRVSFAAGIAVWIRGQESRFQGLMIDNCGTGLKLSDGAKEMYFYDTNVETTDDYGIWIAEGTDSVRGASTCGFWGLHMESNPTHIFMEHGIGIVFDAVHMPIVNTTDFGIRIDASASANTSYTLNGANPQGSPATAKFIADADRGYDVLISDLPGGASAPNVNLFSQPSGSNVPSLGEQRSVTKAVDYTTVLFDSTVLVNAAAATRTITLISAVGIKGKRYTIKKIDASGNVVTVDGNASETIDGTTTKPLAAQYDSITVESDGTNWMVV